MYTSESSACVFVVSDSAGETGEAVIRAAAIQFAPARVDIRRIPFVLDRAEIDEVVEKAKKAGGVIAFTIVVPELRDYLLGKAAENDVPAIDLLGPVIDTLQSALRKEARHQPGILHELNEDYYKKMEAVEFAVKYDDGKDPSGILKADIVLIGVSRTSKTPLSMYLANRRFKVANVPIVPELHPPEELMKVSNKKVVGLMISADKLNSIRQERLKMMGLPTNAQYGKMERIEQELEYARNIMNKIGCTVIDVTNKAVEETASLILEMFRRR